MNKGGIMKNIFVNLESGDGVMIFTENEQITPEVVEKGLRKRGMAVIEAYEVPEHDLQYYIYDPFWPKKRWEDRLLELAASA